MLPEGFGYKPRCVLHGLTVQRGPSEPSTKGTSDGPHPAYPLAPHLEEALTVYFCLIDDRYRLLNPRGARRYESLVGLATKIAAKIATYTYAFLVNRRLDRPQGRIKELWA